MSGTGPWPALHACDFPAGTPLRAFFAWNETRRRPDRRYSIACDLYCLYRRFNRDHAGVAACVSHLSVPGNAPAVAAAERLVRTLLASIGAKGAELHAEVFKAFEDFSGFVDLDALAAGKGRRIARNGPRERRKILVIKLSALGDFVQALGPAAAIRRHHMADEITLLTTRAFADFARQSGFFDKVVLDCRPKPFDIAGWIGLRRVLRNGRFDRVYDLQTSDRSSFYAWLFLPGRAPEWSGIAWHCSHPHANLGRNPQHTVDKQAEQLLMAGIYPTPLPACRVSSRPLPRGLDRRAFFLLMPGSSQRHPEKRWPARCYGALAQRLVDATAMLPVIVGVSGEEPLAAEIGAACPTAIDLVGRTELTTLVDLADAAVFAVGNDTGATHVAAVGGHPVVVLFSAASEPSRCAPRGRDVRIVTSDRLECLSVDLVFARVIETIDDVPTSAPTPKVGNRSA